MVMTKIGKQQTQQSSLMQKRMMDVWKSLMLQNLNPVQPNMLCTAKEIHFLIVMNVIDHSNQTMTSVNIGLPNTNL